jgi:hypothetical protein
VRFSVALPALLVSQYSSPSVTKMTMFVRQPPLGSMNFPMPSLAFTKLSKYMRE